MKQSKLRGYIYNFEHKNKKFSFNKIIKILDVSNTIYLDLINKAEVQKITSYNKSKYMLTIVTYHWLVDDKNNNSPLYFLQKGIYLQPQMK